MSELPEALTKQRRFLMVMSVAVVAYYALSANVKTEVEHLGFVLSIGRPEHFVWGLWIVWGWAVLRYWQQVFARWEPIRTVILAEVSRRQARFTRKAALRLAERLARKGQFGSELSDWRVRNPILRQSNATANWVWTDDAVISFVDQGAEGRVYEDLHLELETRDAAGQPNRVGVNFLMRWTRRKARMIRVRSWSSALWHLPAIGEYVAPFALALLALAAPLTFSPVVAEAAAASTVPT